MCLLGIGWDWGGFRVEVALLSIDAASGDFFSIMSIWCSVREVLWLYIELWICFFKDANILVFGFLKKKLL